VHVPVAIVGGGACGLMTALALRDAGVDCVVLERDAAPSGSTALSSGFIPAAGTRVQAAQGIADSVEVFAADILNKSKSTAAPHLVHAYSRAAAPAIDRLGDHGLRFEVLTSFLYPGHRVHRMHSLPQRTGAALVAAMLEAATRAGADVLTSARVLELWADRQDRILGVGVERPGGALEHISCDVLVLACNGFGGHPALVRDLLPEMGDATFAGHTGNDGSAILWGQALGAGLADLGGYQGHGSWVTPQGALMTWAVMMEGGVQLNARGERFHDETQGYSEAAVDVLAQPDGVAWNVFGEKQLALAREFPDFREAEAAGALRTASSREDPGGDHRLRHAGAGTGDCALRSRLSMPCASPVRCSTRRAAWTSMPVVACAMPTVRPFPTCWPPAAPPAASAATRSGAISRATAC
jgi:fumarate reductase flavoprotein subunit